MTLFVLTCDVRHADHHYPELYELLEKWKATRLQNSVWLVERNSTASAVVDAIEAHMHR